MLNQTFYMEPTKLFPDMVTHAISTYNNLDYLKLALKSIKKNAHYKKVIVYAENCTDGTDEWLRQNYGGDVWPNGETHEPNVRFYIEKKRSSSRHRRRNEQVCRACENGVHQLYPQRFLGY